MYYLFIVFFTKIRTQINEDGRLKYGFYSVPFHIPRINKSLIRLVMRQIPQVVLAKLCDRRYHTDRNITKFIDVLTNHSLKKMYRCFQTDHISGIFRVLRNFRQIIGFNDKHKRAGIKFLLTWKDFKWLKCVVMKRRPSKF